eukprot:Tamp_15180.p1 GENE.Tamp_15180~~Tamp_15180.p1  ORF type:complete len:118 (+),score=3.56 Tamp_15180:521-874(+)
MVEERQMRMWTAKRTDRPRSPVGRPVSPSEAEARDKIVLQRKFPHLYPAGEGQEEINSPGDATILAQVPSFHCTPKHDIRRFVSPACSHPFSSSTTCIPNVRECGRHKLCVRASVRM